MSQYTTILFDLDGTITDSARGIVHSVMHAERRLGRPVSEYNDLLKFVGPPLHKSFEEHCELDEKGGLLAVEYYREYYAEKGIFENEIYTGVEDMLATIQKAGIPVVLATSKPEYYAKKILAHFELDKYFAHICGSNMDGSRTDKHEVVLYAMETAGVTDISKCLMVGDRMHDIIGAKKAGLDSIGVTYGYGSKEELEASDATYIVNSPMEILKILGIEK